MSLSIAERFSLHPEELPPRKPRIYVSGPSRDLERCERAIALCRVLGAEITYDWTVQVRACGGVSCPEDPAVQLKAAVNDLAGVAACDVMLFLDGEHASPGRWVELGAAWQARVPIVGAIPAGSQAYIWHRLLAEQLSSDEDACFAAVRLAQKVS